ncbi:hypothetical protein [Labrys wisconsinensis]|uniref:Chalcone isomerase domain-containing protein n=1 Tax=Labrys wisconsinensis TaxID=425677 RepID=A0ABU0JMR6_9HYPH|nr:hypothetical protein [Labrys wisconsinensis]MDQ0474452.1 hypothetical protein [Labrys wisconsinensis]
MPGGIVRTRTVIPAALALLCCAWLTTPAASGQFRRILHQGTYVHQGSGFAFPEAVGGFQRTGITVFNDGATDVGIGYETGAAGRTIVTTVFVYPAPATAETASSRAATEAARSRACAEHFVEIKAGIETLHPGARLIREGAVASPSPAHAKPGLRAVFEFGQVLDGRRQTRRSEADLYCYFGGEWLVAYRTTASPGVRHEAALARLMRALTWPSRP